MNNVTEYFVLTDPNFTRYPIIARKRHMPVKWGPRHSIPPTARLLINKTFADRSHLWDLPDFPPCSLSDRVLNLDNEILEVFSVRFDVDLIFSDSTKRCLFVKGSSGIIGWNRSWFFGTTHEFVEMRGIWQKYEVFFLMHTQESTIFHSLGRKWSSFTAHRLIFFLYHKSHSFHHKRYLDMSSFESTFSFIYIFFEEWFIVVAKWRMRKYSFTCRL